MLRDLGAAHGIAAEAVPPLLHEGVAVSSSRIRDALKAGKPEAAAALPEAAPRYPQPDGRVKTSAAWLIEHAGFGRGWGDGPARVSTKHSLALTNRGPARASDVLTLARTVRAGVEQAFGVTLEPEPVLVGCSLDPDVAPPGS